MRRLYPLIIRLENAAIRLGKKIVYLGDKLLDDLIRVLVKCFFIIPIYIGIWLWVAWLQSGEWLWSKQLTQEDFNRTVWVVLFFVYWSVWDKKNDD